VDTAAPFPAAGVEFPDHWPSCARNVCLEHRFFVDGIAPSLLVVSEDDVPAWLWRHTPGEMSDRSRRETSLRQVIDRIVGGWTYQSWKGGYFDSEEDARIFHDECRWLLFHRKISPEISQWRFAGRYWAYGHDVSAASTYLTDYRTGKVRRAEGTDLPPHGTVINATGAALAGEGGVWDLWRREADILSHGGHCGANVSNVPPTRSPEAAATTSDILAVGDAVVRASRRSAATRPPKRRLTIDSDHPDCCLVAARPIGKMAEVETDAIGTALARRHVQAIIDACARSEPARRRKVRRNPGLQLALQSARQALLSERLIDRTLKLAESGLARTPDDVLGNLSPTSAMERLQPSDGAATVIRVAGESIEESASACALMHRLFESVMISAWSGIESGIHFESVADSWNTCPRSGPIRSASGDGSFMFLDDTASDLWLIDAGAFLNAGAGYDVDGFQHAVELIAIAADLSLMTKTAVTPRLARRIWDFRPLSLSLTGLGQCLAALGIAYDSNAGRALCAGLGALLTSTACRASARMAEEMGGFPEYERNAADMLRVLDRHSDMVARCTHESSLPGLVEAVEETWSEALQLGAQEGFRNAQVSVQGDAADLAALLDSGTSGLSPLSELVTHCPAQAGYYEKQINPAVPKGLRVLGYDDRQIDAIVRHVTGHGTLAGAPGVNHETLLKRGFTQAAIDAVENAVTMADHISMAFNPFVLGENYCRRMLGFTDTELNDDGFDMLAALGFSDAGIEAANIFCFGAGTLEGAPHLAPEHLAVFDCATPQGARGARYVAAGAIVRMMGSLQPHISGAIGQILTVPADEPVAAYRTLLELAWRLRLKAITLQRRDADRAAIDPESRTMAPDEDALPAFSVIQGGASPVLSRAMRAVEIAEQAEPDVSSESHSGTVVADGTKNAADDSKASRRVLSHAARSAASVPSSADAVVEQRHV